jgi:sugar phosphate isomerase/epimerase
LSASVVFSTGSLYPFGLERVFRWSADAGYDGVEVMMDDRWDTHQAPYLSELVERYSLPVLALHPPIYEGAWRLPTEETLVRSAKLARRIGCPVVVAHPPSPGRPLERWKKSTLAEARAQGVTVAVENMPGSRKSPFGIRSKTCHLPEHLVEVGEVTLDTSHLGASGVDPLDAYAALKENLRHIHLSDSNLIQGRDEHRVPGKGKLPLKEFLGALSRDGYSGAVSLELKPWPLGAPDPELILARMNQSLRFAKEGLEDDE